MSNFWVNYPYIIEELTEIKKIIKKNVKSSEKYFEESVSPLIDVGGKMLRPAFLLLSGRFGEYDSKKMHTLAATIEMLHLATLIHDDIIDDSKLRRGVETIHSKYGKEYAVYTGDFLFCQCFNMLSEYDYNTEILRGLSKAISKICMGEIKQYNLRYAKDMNLRKYMRIISGKTAALFSISFYVGAKESDCNEIIAKNLGKIGYMIGIAYQIMDDILDYNSKTEALGKYAQGDLKNGYYTLPIIFALEQDNKKEISKILDKASLSDKDVKEVIKLVDKYNGIKKAREIAVRYTNKAFDNIDKLPDCESKEILREVTERLLNRNY